MGIAIDGKQLDALHFYKDGQSVGAQAQTTQKASFFSGDGGPSFKDALDTINPLQQIPVVGSLYRSASGDTISPAAKIAGGALFGGPIGAALAAADSLLGMITGKDASQQVMSAMNTEAPPPPPLSQEDATQQAADTAAAQQTAAKAATDATQSPIALDAATSSRAAALYARQEKAFEGNQLVEGMYNKALELRV